MHLGEVEFRYFRMEEEEKEGVMNRLAELLAEVEGVVFAYVHGSFVRRGSFRDVDVAVWIEDAEQAFRYAVDFSVQLEVELGVPVDLHVLNRAPLPFRYRVYTAGKLVFTKDEGVRVGELEETLTRYFDLRALKQKEEAQWTL